MDLSARVAHIAERLPNEIVYAGFSLGAMPALMRAPDASKGALLLNGCVPISEFGGQWPHECRRPVGQVPRASEPAAYAIKFLFLGYYRISLSV
jgi:hypothetical protein